ncbi:DUF4902 domain-containing protein [Roseateles sp. P5_E8]
MFASTPSTMIDPLIRLRTEDLLELQHVHLYSELDGNPLAPGVKAGTVSGYTEWASANRQPALSFSWDWTYSPETQRLQAQWSSLRTNLRVVDSEGEDLGVECTRLCVARLMTRASWERVIAESLDLALTMPPDSRH